MQISTCTESPAENVPLSLKELREIQTPPLGRGVGPPVAPAVSLLWPVEGLEWGALPCTGAGLYAKGADQGLPPSFFAPEI